MRRLLVAAALAIPLIAGAAVAAPTQALAATCSGVWVVVDYGSLGGTSTRCATKYSTGTEALRSAGFSPTLDGGMVLKISGKPSSPDVNKAYWSYWHATRSGDGYGNWSYSDLGANAYHPTQGNAEGWHYLGLSDGKVPPAVAPPKAEPPASPTPTPTATKKATPKPTATRSASTKPTPTAKASTTRPTPTRAATTSAAPSVPATTAAASVTPTPATTELSDGPATATAQDPQPPEQGGGSPIGVIAAGVAVVGGGAGLGGWYLLRGRKR